MGKIRRCAYAMGCAFLALLLAGCGRQTRPLLWYQDTLIWAELAEEGRVWRISPGENGAFTAVLCAPASVAGVSFTVQAGTAYASSGDLVIPIGERMRDGACRAAAALSIPPEALTEVMRAEGDAWAAQAIFAAEAAEYTVAFDVEGCPIWIEERTGKGVRRYTVCAMETADTKETTE